MPHLCVFKVMRCHIIYNIMYIPRICPGHVPSPLPTCRARAPDTSRAWPRHVRGRGRVFRPPGNGDPPGACRARTRGNTQEKKRRQPTLPLQKTAATYSPTSRSTIGASGLNFSVRDGKRWDTGAMAAIMTSTRAQGTHGKNTRH